MKKITIKIILGLTVGAVALLFYAHLETYWLEIKKTAVASKNIPQEFSGKKIAFIGDTHCGVYSDPKRLRTVVDRVNSLSPDIIILGGDYVNINGKSTNACFNELARLKAPLGKFGIIGNHDYEAGITEVENAMREAGIAPLINQNQKITAGSSSITVAGLNNTRYGYPNVSRAMKNAEAFTVIADHDPWFFEKNRIDGAELLLAAHTHGGQITLFGFWIPALVWGHNLKYPNGEFHENNRTIIVTNGIGTGILPLRFMARPQINLITLSSLR